MSTISPIVGFNRAMRHRHYRNYTIGSTLSLIGTWTHRVALGWLTWELTGSYAWLGVISFTDLFVMMLFSPLAGDLADRMDRRWLAFWSQFAMMLQALAIAILVFAGWMDIRVLLALTAAMGVMHAYHTASRLAMVPNLVPREDLTPAVTINSMIFNVARFLGPAAAGLIIVNLGVGAAFAFNSLTFVFFLVVLARVEMMRAEHRTEVSVGIFSSIGEGMRFSMGHAGIGPLLVMLAVTALAARSVPDLLPGFADGVFGRGPTGLAWLTSVMGLGAMASGLLFLTRDGVAGMTALVFQCLMGLGVATVAFASLDVFWIAVAVMAAIGFTMNITGVGILNLMQNVVEGSMRGRVMSMYTLLHQGAPAAGALILGLVAEETGLRWPVGVAGGLALAVGAAMLPRLPVMVRALELTSARQGATGS